MKHRFLLFTTLLTTLSSPLVFAEVAVIVHPSNNNVLDAPTVAKIYLGREKSFADGQSVVPMSLVETAPSSASFNDVVLKKSASQLKAYWSKTYHAFCLKSTISQLN